MTDLLKQFINKVLKIKAEKPSYRQPGDASDGTCDCIGMIIGALKRMGIKWGGIHGSNYAARRATVNFRKISDPSQLEIGEMVFKANEPDNPKNTLPSRYKKGGAYYNGDLRDYYHVGVVTSLNPLNITHMTAPTVKVDTKLGYWAFAGRVKHLDNKHAYDGEAAPVVPPTTEPVKPVTPVTPSTEPPTKPTTGKAVVTAPSGKTVKRRKQPTTKCGMYDNIPIGKTVTLEEYGKEWSKISYGGRKGWYMMSKFLKVG